jgi:hypothetical protein
VPDYIERAVRHVSVPATFRIANVLRMFYGTRVLDFSALLNH